MVKFSSSVLTSSLACLISFPAVAETSIPFSFQGIWAIAADGAAECSISEWKDRDNDGLFRIGAKNIEYWESGCDVRGIKRHFEGQIEVEFQCGGEGMSWKSRNILSLQKYGSSEILVNVQLRQWDDRDDSGRLFRDRPPFKPSIGISYRCK